VFMQREVNSEPASIPWGSSEGARTRNYFQVRYLSCSRFLLKIKGSYIPHSAFEPRVSGDEMAEGFADGSSEIFRAAVASRFFV
jgi:hypothetical protein